MIKEPQNSRVFAFVPSYNHGPYIEKCLRSIFEQTHAPAKLLVIDDGSKDDSPRIIDRVLKDCPFDSELIVRENRGLCATLNEGLELSFGEYFAYIGSDDWWLPEFFEARVALMDDRPNAVIGYGHAFFVDDDGRIFDSTEKYENDWGAYPDGDAREMLLLGISPISSTIFYRRSVLESVRWNETSRLEDYEMYLELVNRGEFAFDPRILSVWRHHSYNTSKDLRMLHNEVIDAQERHFQGLNVSREELSRYQATITFRFARVFMQNGDKLAALRMGVKGWPAAKSGREIAKFAAQFLLPKPLLKAHQQRKRSRFVTAFERNEHERS